MANENILGFIAQIDITDLKAGLSQVKSAIKQTKDDFDASTAGLESWQKSADGLSAKLTQLNTNLKAQEKAVELYEREIERVSSKEGDHSKQLELLSQKLQKAKNDVAKTQVQIEKYTSSLEKAKAKEEEENSALSKLNNSIKGHQTKLKSLENQYKSAVLQYGKYSKEAKAVEKQVKQTASALKKEEEEVAKLEKSYKGLTSQSEKFVSTGKTILKGITTLTAAIGASVAGLVKASEATASFRQNQTRLATAFNKAGLSAKTLNEQYTKLYGVIGDDSKVSNALSFLSQMTKSEEDLNKWTSALIGVYSQFGSKIPIEELAKASNETANTGKVTGQLADAIKQVGGDVDAFNGFLQTLSGSEERQNFILTYLSDAYTDLGKDFQKNNETLIENNKATLNYTKSLSKIGEIGDEVKRAVVDLKTKALDAVYPVILKTVNFIKDNYKWLSSLTAVIAGVGVALLTAGGAVKTWNALCKTATVVQTAWNAVMTANPIGLVVTAIGSLTAGLVLLIKHFDKVKETAENAWKAVKSWFKDDEVLNLTPKIESDDKEIIKGVEERGEEIQKALNELAITYSLPISYVQSAFNKDLDKDLGSFEKKLQEMTGIVREKNETIEKLEEELRDGVKKTAEETAGGVLSVVEEKDEEILNETEQYILARLNAIKEGYDKEIALAEGAEAQNAVKKTYSAMLSDVQKFYTTYAQSFGSAKKTITDALTSLQGEFKVTGETAEETAETTSQSISEKVKQTMSRVSSTISGYVSKITSTMSSVFSLINDWTQQRIDAIDEEYSAFEELYEKEKTALEEANEAKLEELEEQYEKEQELRDEAKEKELDENAKAYKEGLIDDKQYFANKYKIEAKYADLGEKKEKEKADSIQSFNDQLTAHLKQLEDEKLAKEREALEEKNKAAKTQFEAQKANDIATTWINAAVAVVKAFAELGPIVGAFYTAAIMTLAGVQTGIIASKTFTPYTAMAKGGVVDEATLALVGEDGKEAVMPLENNTGWIAELAKELNELQLKDFAMQNTAGSAGQVSYYGDTINNYNYEQTINSPKSLTRAEIYRDSKALLSLKKY